MTGPPQESVSCKDDQMGLWGRATMIGVALLAVLGIGTAGASAYHGGQPLSRLDTIAEHGEVKVCSTGDYRPFTYLDPATGAWSGIDVDMAGDLAHRLGVRLTLVQTT